MCKVHRRYRGVRRPRLACEGCWEYWFKQEGMRGWREWAAKVIRTELKLEP